MGFSNHAITPNNSFIGTFPIPTINKHRVAAGVTVLMTWISGSPVMIELSLLAVPMAVHKPISAMTAVATIDLIAFEPALTTVFQPPQC